MRLKAYICYFFSQMVAKTDEIMPAQESSASGSYPLQRHTTPYYAISTTDSDSDSGANDNEVNENELGKEIESRGQTWTHLNIVELYRMYQSGLSISRIAHFLGRSTESCHSALRKIMVQQILHTSLEDVKEHYDDERIPDLLESKYNIPMDEGLSFGPVRHTWDNTPWGIFVYLFFVLAVIGYGKYTAPINGF